MPEVIVGKPPSADLVVGQTDEGDFGISYAKADEILNWMLSGYAADDLVARGFDAAEVALVRKRLETTHWKRRLPTVAMLSRIGDRRELPAAGGLLSESRAVQVPGYCDVPRSASEPCECRARSAVAST